jgi:hypothetical protein
LSRDGNPSPRETARRRATAFHHLGIRLVVSRRRLGVWRYNPSSPDGDSSSADTNQRRRTVIRRLGIQLAIAGWWFDVWRYAPSSADGGSLSADRDYRRRTAIRRREVQLVVTNRRFVVCRRRLVVWEYSPIAAGRWLISLACGSSSWDAYTARSAATGEFT